jgi:transposase-like protein
MRMVMPINDLLDEDKCCRLLMETLHPGGLRCPEGHALPPDQPPHDRRRAPILDYRCKECRSVFNLFTGTVLQGRHWKCSTIVLILRGFAQGTSTLQLSQELGLGRRNLLYFRHRVQGLCLERFSPLDGLRPGGRGRRDVPERRGKGRPSP